MESAKRPKRRKMKGITTFASYFKEKRRKEEEKKERRLQEADENLKEILTPHAWSLEEKERLDQLKRYKEWRRMQQQQHERRIVSVKTNTSAVVSSSTDVPEVRMTPQTADGPGQSTSGIVSEAPFMDALHHHTWGQRIAVVSTLLVLLFVTLHADVIAEKLLPAWLFVEGKPTSWWVYVLRDTGKFWHMSLCALIHFALCDISLIYAFESIELGMKTGPKVKKLYREKVHVAVAALSGGIMAFSILWALLMAWVRMIWSIVDLVTDYVTGFSHVINGWVSSFSLSFQNSWVLLRSAPFRLMPLTHFQNSWIILKSSVITMYTTPPSELVSSFYNRLIRMLAGICISILAVLIPFDGTGQPSERHILSLLFGNESLPIPGISQVEPILENQTDVANATVNAASGVNATLNATSDAIMNTSSATSANMTMDLTLSATLREAMNATSEMTLNVSKPTVVLLETTMKVVIPHWSQEAFETCRCLLSHSAVFSLAVLVTLNIVMKSYRYNEGRRPPASGEPAPNRNHQTTFGGSLVVDASALHTKGSTRAPTTTDLEVTSTNTYSTAKPTNINVSISSSSVSSNDEGRHHLHKA